MTIDEMAQAIHEAHLKGMPALLDVLQSLAADEVTITYHPSRHFVEGTMSAAKWIAFERGMVAKADERGMRVETGDQKISVDGDDIVLEEVMVSTDPDGKSFRVPFRGVFHVRDEKVTGYDAYVDPSTTPAFLEQDEKAVREAL
jgi:ketosteroid isomerase-like protein